MRCGGTTIRTVRYAHAAHVRARDRIHFFSCIMVRKDLVLSAPADSLFRIFVLQLPTPCLDLTNDRLGVLPTIKSCTTSPENDLDKQGVTIASPALCSLP
jgi:hypothetical protein